MSTSASGLNFGFFVYEYVVSYILSSAVVSILDRYIYRNLYIPQLIWNPLLVHAAHSHSYHLA